MHIFLCNVHSPGNVSDFLVSMMSIEVKAFGVGGRVFW